jgi:hypothetical protein
MKTKFNELDFLNLMLYVFRAANYYANLLIKPTAAQLHLYTLQHVSAASTRSSSGRVFFLDKAAYGTSVLINIYIYNHCRVLKVYVRTVVGVHRKFMLELLLVYTKSLC